MITLIRKNFLFLLLAPMLGVLLGSYLSTLDMHDRIAFWWRPVVSMQGELVASPKDGYAVIRMSGTKNRGVECEYRGLQAFGERVAGPVVDLRIARLDLPEEGTTKPSGAYDIGTWRVWPVDGVQNVTVYVSHSCNGKKVATLIAEVNL